MPVDASWGPVGHRHRTGVHRPVQQMHVKLQIAGRVPGQRMNVGASLELDGRPQGIVVHQAVRRMLQRQRSANNSLHLKARVAHLRTKTLILLGGCPNGKLLASVRTKLVVQG